MLPRDAAVFVDGGLLLGDRGLLDGLLLRRGVGGRRRDGGGCLLGDDRAGCLRGSSAAADDLGAAAVDGAAAGHEGDEGQCQDQFECVHV